MSKAKQVKLTPSQQEVVNLMAAGWDLKWHEGIRFHYWEELSKGDETRKVKVGTGSSLKKKGVCELVPNQSQYSHTTEFRLTNLGRSLAGKSDKPTKTRWWWLGRNSIDITHHDYAGQTEHYLIHETGRKDAKRSEWGKWHATRADAVQAAHDSLKRRLENAKSAVTRAAAELARFERKEKLT